MRPKGKSLKQVGQEWINFHFCLVGQSNINTFSFSDIFWEDFVTFFLRQIIVRDKNLRKCEIVGSFSYYGGGQFSFMVIVTFFIWNELPLVESLKDPTLQVLTFLFTKSFGITCGRRAQFQWKSILLFIIIKILWLKLKVSAQCQIDYLVSMKCEKPDKLSGWKARLG